ncbi:MAG TPA: glycosyltransferase family 4 protein [Anaerolineales bacterium]|nr:glycosyltransferase family 4 protein [Anaerolineales bacterium]
MSRIAIVPAVAGLGGMTTFRLKMEAGLNARGIEVTHDAEAAVEAILVIAGTRNLIPLWRAKRRGIRVVQRLDGINWIHRRKNTGIKHFLRAEYGNWNLAFIRSRIATHILYQSRFSRLWWEDWYGRPDVPFSVVHNGVDLNMYRPVGAKDPPKDEFRVLVVEGNLGGGYDMGLDHAIQLTETLADRYRLPVELMVVGKISEEQKAAAQARSRVLIRWAGVVPREQIPQIDHSAHVLFSADINAACPNSVVEAMACGLPVVGFDTGALNELVIGDSGRLVAYGGNVWKLDHPDIESLAKASVEILKNQNRFRQAARAQAEKAFGLDKMVDEYLKVLLEA